MQMFEFILKHCGSPLPGFDHESSDCSPWELGGPLSKYCTIMDKEAQLQTLHTDAHLGVFLECWRYLFKIYICIIQCLLLLGVKHDASTRVIYCENFFPMCISTPRSSHGHKSPHIQMKIPQHLARTILGEKPRSNTKIFCICFNLSVALGGLGLLHHCKRCQISTLMCLLVDFPVIALLDLSQRERSLDDG